VWRTLARGLRDRKDGYQYARVIDDCQGGTADGREDMI